MDGNEFISRMDGVRQTAPGQWIAKCPGHDDNSPSLSVKETDDGTILIHCFAGCSAQQIVESVGLELSDLFPPCETYSGPIKKRRNYKAAWLLSKHSFWILALATNSLERNEKLNEADLASVRKARARILDVMEVINGE